MKEEREGGREKEEGEETGIGRRQGEERKQEKEHQERSLRCLLGKGPTLQLTATLSLLWSLPWLRMAGFHSPGPI